MVVHGSAEVEAKHAAHLLVEGLQQVGTALSCSFTDELLVGLSHVVGVVGIGTSHGQSVGPRAELHVESVEDGLLGIVAAAPVRYDHAVVLPVALQDAVQHHLIMTIVLVFIEIVGTHDAPCLALSDSSTEGRKIDFVQSAVANYDIDLMAVLFVVVQGIVLHARSYAFRLQSLHVGHYHTAGQPGVFAHILEVTSSERCAIDVHTRSQDHVFAAIACLFTQALTIETGKICVPSSSQARQRRECHTRVVGLSGLNPLVPKHVGTYTVRSVVGPEIGHT